MAKGKGTSVVRGIGDNSGETEVDGDKLQKHIDIIEKVERKKDQLLQELREDYASAKAAGYSTKTIRRIIKERKMEPEKLKEEEETLHIYRRALGILAE